MENSIKSTADGCGRLGQANQTNTGSLSRAEFARQPGHLVDAQGLLIELFQPESRPSLAWVRRQTRARAIPAVRIGRLVFYDIPAVREKLARKNTVNAK